MKDHANLIAIFLECVETRPQATAVIHWSGNAWIKKTWRDFENDVKSVAVNLQNHGVVAGDRVAMYSENRYEWLVVDLAIQMAMAIHVPIHAPLTGVQAAYQINDSGAKVVVVSTPEQAAKLAAVPQHWPTVTAWVAFDPLPASHSAPKYLPFAEWLKADLAKFTDVGRQAAQELDGDSLATILYTSGTTGEPKGVMLNQHNLVSNATSVVRTFGTSSDDLRLTLLPLSHIFARTCDMYSWLVSGCQLALARARETVLEDCATLRPTLLNAVPYFYDKVRRGLIDAGKADVPNALRDLLGGRLGFCCSGGAALPEHVFDFFVERNVPILQGYGLSETSPVISMSTLQHYRRSASGKLIDNVEVRIEPDGEVLTRGPHVMIGYYKNQAATDQVLSDGWFRTGDYGRLDEDGFLFIEGRKKELIVTTGGKNIAPVLLESKLTEDPLIIQAVVIGDDRDYLTALIVPNPDALRDEIIRQKIPVLSRDAALKHPRVIELYTDRIKHCLRDLSHHEQVRRFHLMNRGFTIESGELTPKLSLRRREIEANCRALIEAMYARS